MRCHGLCLSTKSKKSVPSMHHLICNRGQLDEENTVLGSSDKIVSHPELQTQSFLQSHQESNTDTLPYSP